MRRPPFPLLLLAALGLLPACQNGSKKPPPPEALPEGTVWGAVIDDDGAPIVGAQITVRTKDPLGKRVIRRTKSQRGGRYRFESLPPGRARFSIAASGLFAGRATVLVPALKSIQKDLILIRTRTVEGVVVCGKAGIEGVTVVATPLVAIENQADEQGATDAQGRFVIGGLRPGEYELRVSLSPDARHPDGSFLAAAKLPATGVTAGLKSAKIVVPEGASLLVFAASKSVQVEGKRMRSRRYPIGEAGQLRLRGLLPGTYFVSHTTAGGETKAQEVTVSQAQAQKGSPIVVRFED